MGPVPAGLLQRPGDEVPLQRHGPALYGEGVPVVRLSSLDSDRPAHRFGKTGEIQHPGLAEHQPPLDAVFQLPHVPGPAVADQRLQRIRRRKAEKEEAAT